MSAAHDDRTPREASGGPGHGGAGHGRLRRSRPAAAAGSPGGLRRRGPTGGSHPHDHRPPPDGWAGLDRRLCRRPSRPAEPGRARIPVPGLCAQQRRRDRGRHRPGHPQGGRPLLHRAAAPACRPLLGPAEAVGHQRPEQQPDPDRPGHRPARPPAAGRRPLQPLLHPRRQPGHRGRRAASPARLPGPPHDAAAPLAGRALHWRRPPRLHRRWSLPAGQLRVQRRAGQGGRPPRTGASRCPPRARQHPPGRQAGPGRTPVLCGRHATQRRPPGRRRRGEGGRVRADRSWRPRPLREPGLPVPVRVQPG